MNDFLPAGAIIEVVKRLVAVMAVIVLICLPVSLRLVISLTKQLLHSFFHT